MTDEEKEVVVKFLDTMYRNASLFKADCSAFDDPLISGVLPRSLLERMERFDSILENFAYDVLSFNCSLE